MKTPRLKMFSLGPEHPPRVVKAKLYKTAKARIACAHFAAGQFVSVEYASTTNGTNWFLIRKTDKGELPYPVAYPEHHLTDFVL